MKTTHAQGFTLIELMVTLSMMGIVLAIGVPSFKDTVRSGILTSEMNGFVATLNFARSEAVKRSMRVTVRRTSTNHSEGWEEGWQVFTDVNADGTPNGTDEKLRVHGALRNNYTLRGNRNFSNFISFKPSGESNSMGSFALCDNSDGSGTPKPGTSRVITVNILGRITLGKDSDKNGVPEQLNGDGNPEDITSCTSP